MHQKYLNLCSEDERRSYRFGTTRGWVINDRTIIFGWTIPLNGIVCLSAADVLSYPLSTSRNQVLVQSQCYCRFLVGSTAEPFKNRLLFHRDWSYVTEYVSSFVSLVWPRQRQTQQTCSRCISATQTDRLAHNTLKHRESDPKAEPSAVQSLPQHPDASRSADPSRTNLNKLSTMADVALLLMFMALRTYIGIQTQRIQRV